MWSEVFPNNRSITNSCNCNLTLNRKTKRSSLDISPELQPHNLSDVIGLLLISFNFRVPGASSRISHNKSHCLWLFFYYYLSFPAFFCFRSINYVACFNPSERVKSNQVTAITRVSDTCNLRCSCHFSVTRTISLASKTTHFAHNTCLSVYVFRMCLRTIMIPYTTLSDRFRNPEHGEWIQASAAV